MCLVQILDSCFCCQSATSVCVSPCYQLVSTVLCQSGRCKLSQLKATSFYPKQQRQKYSKRLQASLLNSHKNPVLSVLRHNRYFTSTAKRTNEALKQCMLPSKSIRSAPVCSSRILWDIRLPCIGYLPSLRKVPFF